MTDYTFMKRRRSRLLVTCARCILNGGKGVRDTDSMSASFDELLEEAEAVSVDGWDFSWLEGRATEERPPWGYARLLGQRLAGVEASLDIQTGGGDVLAQWTCGRPDYAWGSMT